MKAMIKIGSLKVIFVIWCLLSFCIKAIAVPAYPYKVFVSTFNGKRVAIYMKGDETQRFAITEDGYTILCDSVGWWYASLSNDSTLIKSEFCLTALEDETTELKNFKTKTPKGIVPKRNVKSSYSRASNVEKVKTSEPLVGERRALVILMQYKDLPFNKTKEDFEHLFNQLDYNLDGATGSVRDFYHYASQGQLDYISDVYGPYTAQNPMRYYGANDVYGNDIRALDLCIEAIKNLPKDVNYSIYDNDNDGLVDNVHIIFAGHGEEAGASSSAIWAHEYPYRIPLRNEVGYSFASYSCSPELRGNNGSYMTNIGVICHELGHALGAKDFYDTNYQSGGEYLGTGLWDIMASGSWNDEGRTPPNFNPYVRIEVFGWNTQVVLEANKQVSIPRMDLEKSEPSVVYRINTECEGDYFLLENRQKYLFDSALPGSGLMIYHVHPNLERSLVTNSVNVTHPQGLYPVCASYSDPQKKQYGKINTSECPFPGSKNVRSFSSETTPAAVAWNGAVAKLSISDITQNEHDGSISFSTVSENTDDSGNSSDPDTLVEKNIVHEESFESNASQRFSIESLLGKEVWKAYSKGGFVLNSELIPDPTDGKKLFMLFVAKGMGVTESEAVSSNISIEPGVNYTLSFDIRCEVNSELKPTFNLFVEDEYGEYKLYSLNKNTNGWEKITIPLLFASDEFTYKLYGKLSTGGIFIDNIQLLEESRLSHNKNILKDEFQGSTSIYSITGTKLKAIGKGINIIKCPDGRVIKVLSTK